MQLARKDLTRNIWKLRVKTEEIPVSIADALQRLSARFRDFHHVAVELETARESTSHSGVVIDDQDCERLFRLVVCHPAITFRCSRSHLYGGRVTLSPASRTGYATKPKQGQHRAIS